MTTSRFPLRHLGDLSPRRYLDSVAAEARAHPDTVLLNGFIPRWLTFAPNTYAAMFEDLPHVRVSDTVTGDPYLVDRHGRYLEAVFHPVGSLADTVPEADACPARLAPGSSTWPLDGPFY